MTDTDTQKDGGAAYPHTKVFENGTGRAQSGMSLRDYFAGQALQGALVGIKGPRWPNDDTAKWAYAQADAMLAARATPQPDPVRDELVEALQGISDRLLEREMEEVSERSIGFNMGLKAAMQNVDAALSKAKEGQ